MSNLILVSSESDASANATTASLQSAAAANAPRRPLPPHRMPLVVSRDDLYFWTASWQDSEARAEEDLAAGRYVEFESPAAAVRCLIDNDQA